MLKIVDHSLASYAEMLKALGFKSMRDFMRQFAEYDLREAKITLTALYESAREEDAHHDKA